MIIGISGKIGSGKDEVGNINHYFNSVHKGNGYNTKVDYSATDNGWETKKFADKLKDMVCMLIGCTRIQLEDRNFKESTLGPEWDKWAVVNYYLNNQVGKVEDNGLYATKEEAIKEEKNMRIAYSWSKTLESKFEKVQMTPRLMLQLLGTDCGREIIHPNVWVNSLMADYKPQTIIEDAPYKTAGIRVTEDLPNWIITDTRFPNEAEAVTSKGGLLLRVERGDGNTGTHPSETALDGYKGFHYTIDNNGTIEDLVVKVERILKREGLI